MGRNSIIKMITTLIISIFFINGFNSVVLACTGFTTSNDSIVLVGNNEDWRYPDSYIRIYPPSDSSYGRVIFDVNFPLENSQNYYSAFGGMNDQGLFFDIYSHPNLVPINSSDKPDFNAGEIARYIMRVCSSVDEVVEEFNKYNLEFMDDIQYFFVDRSGNSVIIEGDEIIYKEKNYQVVTNFLQSNPSHGWHPCWRFDTAVSMLENMTDFSVDYFRDICNATHQEHYLYPTQYSNICDLNNGIIYLYHYYNYNNVIEIDIYEEFENGIQSIYLPSLFEPLNNQPPNVPTNLEGQLSGRNGNEYTYSCDLVIDPDNTPNEIYYMFDWGDYSNSNWIKPSYGSNKIYASHTWNEQGIYEIKVKSRDIFGLESEWSDSIEVSMPKSKLQIDFNQWLFRLIQRFPILEFLL
jgi:predicted choloylglycine hydrolase